MSLRATIAVFSVCLLPLHLCAQTAAQPLVLQFGTVDSLFPNICVPGDQCYPNIANRDNPARTSLGGVGDNEHVGWKNVNFPSNPDSIIATYASDKTSVMDFYLDSLNGLFLWSFALPVTSDTGYFWTQPWVSNSTKIDYSLFPEVPVISGSHNLYVAFSCGAAGCGQYHSIALTFTPVGVKTARVGNAGRSKRQGISLVNLSMAGAVAPYSRMSSVLYDLRGRRLVHAPAMHTGIAVVKPVQP